LNRAAVGETATEKELQAFHDAREPFTPFLPGSKARLIGDWRTTTGSPRPTLEGGRLPKGHLVKVSEAGTCRVTPVTGWVASQTRDKSLRYDQRLQFGLDEVVKPKQPIEVTIVREMKSKPVFIVKFGRRLARVTGEHLQPLRDQSPRGFIASLITGLDLDCQGHFKSGAVVSVRDFRVRSYSLPDNIPKSLLRALNGGPPSEWVQLSFIERYRCPYCERRLKLMTNGKVLRFSDGEPCSRPEGLPHTDIELNVPSGKIVFGNDLRDWFPSNRSSRTSTDGPLWQHGETLVAAEVGLATGYVGNTCPGVYRMPDGSLEIQRGIQEEVWDAEARDWVPNDPEILAAFQGEEVASISTELWWYGAADLDEYTRREGDMSIVTVVGVPPGVYRFRNFHREGREISVYVKITRVRGPEPLEDFDAKRAAINWTAEQTLWQSVRQWPTLFASEKRWEDLSEEAKARALARAADHLMCVGGNGREWHEKGFPLVPYTDKTAYPIPPFLFRSRWYPWFDTNIMRIAAGLVNREGEHEKVMLALAEGRDGFRGFNPSFAKLALNICMSIISYGYEPDSRGGARRIEPARERMRDAIKIYRGLRKTYPEVVFDETFDAWMHLPKVAERWVKNFYLGKKGSFAG